MKICKKLWLIREELKLSRREVGEALHVSGELINQIENERTKLSLEVFLELCKLYNVSPIEILNNNPEEHFILMKDNDIEELNNVINKINKQVYRQKNINNINNSNIQIGDNNTMNNYGNLKKRK